MSTAHESPREEGINYLNAEYGWKSWLFTTDHKRIAVLYLVSISLMFMLGGYFASMIRLGLVTPQGDLLSSATYNKYFTKHGIVLGFFFRVPSIPETARKFRI